MLAIAAFYEIWQKNIKTAFLNGFLKEQLYLMQPKGFVDPKEEVQNGSVKERVLACVTRCEIE